MVSTEIESTRRQLKMTVSAGTGTGKRTPRQSSKRKRTGGLDDKEHKRTTKRTCNGPAPNKRKLLDENCASSTTPKRTKKTKLDPDAPRQRPKIIWVVTPKHFDIPKIKICPPSPRTSTGPQLKGRSARVPPKEPALLYPVNPPPKSRKRETKLEKSTTPGKLIVEGDGKPTPKERIKFINRRKADTLPKASETETEPSMFDSTKTETSTKRLKEEATRAAAKPKRPNPRPRPPREEKVSKLEFFKANLHETPEQSPFTTTEITNTAEILTIIAEICEENPRPEASAVDALLYAMGELPPLMTYEGRRKEPDLAASLVRAVYQQPNAKRWGTVEALEKLRWNLEAMQKFEQRARAQPQRMMLTTLVMREKTYVELQEVGFCV
ncbi:hypothetical protein BGZ61DRAFT_472070 [Ilyonectria robusta]|uniref:uncharacterized protein n=1 Tax=Ilyonectria robusta TaxID=1079257 RepID=UPI001E8DF8D5|nr:uncharacterized protein BGZ61DRAFT_472070 [Ilyonectria robusta]KAH8735659.1 hypothetical protein BGZ61DRAFT_472070 [Ilyonectria robusta]